MDRATVSIKETILLPPTNTIKIIKATFNGKTTLAVLDPHHGAKTNIWIYNVEENQFYHSIGSTTGPWTKTKKAGLTPDRILMWVTLFQAMGIRYQIININK